MRLYYAGIPRDDYLWMLQNEGLRDILFSYAFLRNEKANVKELIERLLSRAEEKYGEYKYRR